MVIIKVFLYGGNAGSQTTEAAKRLNEVICHSKPCLYIPLAMNQQKYNSCYKWIINELKNVNIPYIEMIKSAGELASKPLTDYSFLLYTSLETAYNSTWINKNRYGNQNLHI